MAKHVHVVINPASGQGSINISLLTSLSDRTAKRRDLVIFSSRGYGIFANLLKVNCKAS